MRRHPAIRLRLLTATFLAPLVFGGCISVADLKRAGDDAGGAGDLTPARTGDLAMGDLATQSNPADLLASGADSAPTTADLATAVADLAIRIPADLAVVVAPDLAAPDLFVVAPPDLATRPPDLASPDLSMRPDLAIAVPADLGMPTTLGPFALTGCPTGEYRVNAQVGGQSFALLVDTGSSTAAVASTACANCNGINPEYTPGVGAIDQRQTASATYGGGTGWSGEIYQDNLTLPGLGFQVPMRLVAITSNNNFFGILTGCTGFGADTYQGILGIGPSGAIVPGTDDFLDNLAALHPGLPSVVALRLCGSGGSMWLGGYDPAAAATPPLTTPATMNGRYYQVQVGDVAVSGASLGLHAADWGQVIVDSGTSNFYVPQLIYNSIVGKVLSSNAFVQAFGVGFFTNGQCVQAKMGMTTAGLDATLPTVTLSLPGVGPNSGPTLDLKASNAYIAEAHDVQGNMFYCPALFASGTAVLGDIVLRTQLTVIDRARWTVAFAPQNGCP